MTSSSLAYSIQQHLVYTEQAFYQWRLGRKVSSRYLVFFGIDPEQLVRFFITDAGIYWRCAPLVLAHSAAAIGASRRCIRKLAARGERRGLCECGVVWPVGAARVALVWCIEKDIKYL